MGLTLKPYLRLLPLLWLAYSSVAMAQFVPSASQLRSVDSFHVKQDGRFTQTIESLLRVDTPQGVNAWGEQKITYNEKLEKLEIIEAYTLLKDGSRIDVPPERIRVQDDTSGGDSMFSDEKVMVIIFPQVEVGAQLYYHANAVQLTPVFPGHFFWARYYSPHIRYEEARIELTHEAGIAIRVDAERLQGGPIELLAGDAPGTVRYRYTFSQHQAYPGESSRVGLPDFAPHLAFSSFASYADFAQAYQQRAKPMAAVTPAISTLAHELAAGAKDERERVRRLYNWVSANIRYLAVYAGAGGWVPHPAQSVLDNRYGDCKDHVVLLEALLAALGIDSSTALIGTEYTFELPLLPIATPFDHVITYVPALDLFLDSTSQFSPMGTLPGADMDKPVLLTATGTIARTPPRDPARDYTDTEVSLTVQEDGRVLGQSRTFPHGFMETDSRAAQFSCLNRDQARTVDDLLSRFQETGVGRIKRSEPMSLDTPWQVEADFELDPVINVPGPSAMPIPIGVAPGRIKSLSSAKVPPARRFPFACASASISETTTLAFANSMQVQHVPQNVLVNAGAYQYQASYQLEGQLLTVKRQLQTRRTKPVCNEEDDRHWNVLREALQRDLRAQVFLK